MGALTPGSPGSAAPRAVSWTSGLGQPSSVSGTVGAHRRPIATAPPGCWCFFLAPLLDTAPRSAEDFAVSTPGFPRSEASLLHNEKRNPRLPRIRSTCEGCHQAAQTPTSSSSMTRVPVSPQQPRRALPCRPRPLRIPRRGGAFPQLVPNRPTSRAACSPPARGPTGPQPCGPSKTLQREFGA